MKISEFVTILEQNNIDDIDVEFKPIEGGGETVLPDLRTGMIYPPTLRQKQFLVEPLKYEFIIRAEVYP